MSSRTPEAGHGRAIFPLRGSEPAGSAPERTRLRRWMRTLPKPVGVVACYDIRGQQVLDACRATRLRVPDEVAVIGQHNDELLCDLCNPPLTSVIPNARRAGFVAAQLLHGMMHRRRTHAARVIEIAPVGVTTRASTDTVAVADPRLAAALRHLQTHASGSVLIKEVARHAGLLERGFRSHFGCAPDEHLLRLRMDRARRLLLETDLPTAEVAAQCGFQSAEHFSATFRQREGRSPAAFRRGGVIATSPR